MKYELNEIMTLSEAVERYQQYGVTMDKIKNRLKPSKSGQEKIDQWVTQGIIKLSGRTWLISVDFMDLHFKK